MTSETTRRAGPTGQVRVTGDGPVVQVVLDRQDKLNALTLEMLHDLEQVLTGIADRDARVVVLRTAGERVFSVGADIHDFSGMSPVDMWRRWLRVGHRVFDLLAGLPCPTVAVVDGLAAGGGLELALACDFRVVREDAHLVVPETGLGVIPGWGGTTRLTRMVGAARAKELVLTRRRLTGAEAVAWGLATRSASAEGLGAEVDALVADLLRSAPVAVAVAKQMIDAAEQGAPAHVVESLGGGLVQASADKEEGVAAFLARREPQFLDR